MPDSVNAPAPALVIPKAPEITPPKVNVFALEVMVGEAPNAFAAVPKFKELVPVKVKLPLMVIG